MPKRNRIFPVFTLTLDTIAGGGQALGTLEDGRKCFVWGGLPGESVVVQFLVYAHLQVVRHP